MTEATFTPSGPGVLMRGGDFNFGAIAGLFAVKSIPPQFVSSGIGFRAAR